MTDINPKLTKDLRERKSELLTTRESLLRQLQEVEAQVGALDRVISIYDSEHIFTDVSFGRGTAPMLELQAQKQLPAPEASDTVIPKKSETKPPKSASKAEEKTSEEAVATKTKKTGLTLKERNFIGKYYSGFNRNQLILEILLGHNTPLKAQQVQMEIFAIHPLKAPTKKIKNLIGSRIAASLHHLSKRGDLVRHDTGPDGANGVHWSLTAAKKKDLKRSQKLKPEATESTDTSITPAVEGMGMETA